MRKKDVLPYKQKLIENRIGNKLKDSLTCRDVNTWLELFKMQDELALESQKSWYVRYINHEKFENMDVNVNSFQYQGERTAANVTICIRICGYEPVEETYFYWMEQKEDSGEYKIVWFDRVRLKLKNAPGIDLDFKIKEVEIPVTEEELCGNEKKEYDMDINLLIRSISRSIRFREANPLLEMVLLISNMMSIRCVSLAKQLQDEDPLLFLKKLYNASIDKIYIKLVRDDRNNSWISKFTAPSYGIDELIALGQEKSITGNCSQVIAVYYAILRWVFKPNQLFQVRFGNYDALFIKVERELYYLSDILIKVTSATLFRDTDITKIFNETFIVTNNDRIGIDSKDYEELRLLFFKNAPDLVLPQPLKLAEREKPSGLDMEFKNSNLWDMKESVTRQVLRKSVNSKLFTLSKYALQSLQVAKPQVYLRWSMQSLIVEEFIKKHAQLSEFNKAVSKFEQSSIFCEKDRIMTADQIIRHKKGDWKSIAVLYYVWFKKQNKKVISICFSSDNGYCTFEGSDQWFDVKKKAFVKKIYMEHNRIYVIRCDE